MSVRISSSIPSIRCFLHLFVGDDELLGSFTLNKGGCLKEATHVIVFFSME